MAAFEVHLAVASEAASGEVPVEDSAEASLVELEAGTSITKTYMPTTTDQKAAEAWEALLAVVEPSVVVVVVVVADTEEALSLSLVSRSWFAT